MFGSVINFSTFSLQTQTEILANITVTERSDCSLAASIQFGVHRYTVLYLPLSELSDNLSLAYKIISVWAGVTNSYLVIHNCIFSTL